MQHGPVPYWVAFLMEEYYWLEKHFLPHGNRDEHDWEYLYALHVIDSKLAQLREAKIKKQREQQTTKRARDSANKVKQSGAAAMKPGGGGFSLSGPGVTSA